MPKQKDSQFNQKQYSLSVRILSLMILGSICPLLVLTICDYMRFHAVLLGKEDALPLFYAGSILLAWVFVGYVVCSITKPIKALVDSIKGYRLEKIKPTLKNIAQTKEFSYLGFDAQIPEISVKWLI